MRPSTTLALACLAALAWTSPDPTAKALVERGIREMGGREKLLSIRTVTSPLNQHEFLVEQSERPEGPYVVTYSIGKQSVDFERNVVASEVSQSGFVYGSRAFTRKFEVGFAKSAAATPAEARFAQHRLALGPERVLLSAVGSDSLKLGQKLTLQGVPHQAVEFASGSTPVRLLLNTATGLPTAVEAVERGEGFFSIWGDVTTRYLWGNWTLVDGGVLLPAHWVQERNGLRTMESHLLDLKAEYGSTGTLVDLPRPAPSAPVDAQVKAFRRSEVAPGVFQYTGGFNSVVIEQKDGLVVFEPVNGSAFAARFLDRLATEYPGKKVKAVVATTDAWPHFGGIRSFAAKGITLYVLDQNKPIVERLLRAPYTLEPDLLATHPRKAKIVVIKDRITIGIGDERVEIAPIRGETCERMLMAYLPKSQTLYASDTIQSMGANFFAPAMLLEVRAAVDRNGWNPTRAFALHSPAIPYQKILDALTKLGR